MDVYKDGFTIELSAVCLYKLYGKLDTLLHLYYYELLTWCTYKLYISMKPFKCWKWWNKNPKQKVRKLAWKQVRYSVTKNLTYISYGV